MGLQHKVSGICGNGGEKIKLRIKRAALSRSPLSFMQNRLGGIIFWLAFCSAFILTGFYWWLENFYLVVTFPLGVLGLLFLFLIQKSARVSRLYSPTFSNVLLGLGGIIFFITSFGTLFLYNGLFGYDLGAHFGISVLFVIMAAMLYELLRFGQKIPSTLETIVVSVVLVLVFSLFWEFYEKYGDIWWNTKMFFDPWQEISIDTATDLSANFLGIFVASVLIFKNWDKWNKKWLKNKS